MKEDLHRVRLGDTDIPGIDPTSDPAAFQKALEDYFRTEHPGEIDGLDKWGVFWRIAIPLSKPIIATMTLFYVVQYWNDWFDAFLYLDTTTKWPVAYYLRQLISSASGTSADAGDAMQIASNIKSCAMVLTSAPIICIYPFIQKYFVQGMMLGGVKG